MRHGCCNTATAGSGRTRLAGWLRRRARLAAIGLCAALALPAGATGAGSANAASPLAPISTPISAPISTPASTPAPISGIAPADILPPEQAYPVRAEVDAAGKLSLVWDIAPGYYLYRKRFGLEAKSAGLVLGEAAFPAGKIKDDEFFGPMEVFRGQLVVPVAVEALGPGAKASIAARMQGCGDMGICFPPNTASVEFDARKVALGDSPARRRARAESTAAGASPTGNELARDLLDAPTRADPRSAPSLTPLASLAPLATAATAPMASPASAPAAGPSPSSAPGSLLGNVGSALREAFGGSTQSFLPVEQAFVVTAEQAGASNVRVRFDIAEGYYLYKDKLGFKARTGAAIGAGPVPSGAEIRLGEVALPPGEVKNDEYFGRVETYRERIEADVALAEPVAGPVVLTVDYQGCADAGLCYPPSQRHLSLNLSASANTLADAGGRSDRTGPSGNAASDTTPNSSAKDSVDVARDAASPALSETDRIVRTLAEGNLWLIAVAFYVFGLLLSFTPCVLPMVPILSSILVGQDPAQRRSLFGLSVVYVLAMALTYAAAGVIAGKLGENLQAAFQHPAVLIAFVLVFIALAASMFGLYELQLPASWQSRLAAWSGRQRGGSYLGAGVMGFFSALIVGPCVAAPLAAALVYIGQTGDATLGALALLTMALGMGTPLLIIGASAGSLLPKVGPWMDSIKRVFGFVLLGVAIYLLERLIPAPLSLALWALLLIIAGVFAGALDAIDAATTAWRRLSKGAGLAMLTYGVLLAIGAAAGGDDMFRPLRTLSLGQGEASELAFRPIKGPDELDAALTLARANGQAVMLDYYADWCVSCKELERYTFRDPQVRAALAGVTLLRTDVTANDDADAALLARFGLYGPPAILFFDLAGNERPGFRVIGYLDAERFRLHVERTLSALALAER